MTQPDVAHDNQQFELPIGGPWRENWVPYGRGVFVLSRLKELIEREPSVRPQNYVLYGDTNSGKSTIVRRFRDQLNEQHRRSPDQADETPVVYTQTPPEGDAKTLLWLILRELNVITPITGSIQSRYAQLIEVLPKSRTRMLILDEVHNVLAAPRNRQELFLQVLKFFSNELHIPIVCVGTVARDAREELARANVTELKENSASTSTIINACASLLNKSHS